MKTKKFFYDFSLANLIATIVLAIFVFFSIFNIKDAIVFGILSAITLSLLSGALNGFVLGGLSSALTFIAAIIYKVNYANIPAFKLSKKIVEKIGPEAAKAKVLLKIENYKAMLEILDKYKILYFLLAIAVAFIGRFIFLKLKANTKETVSVESSKKISAKTLSYLAMFIALSVVLNTLRVGSISFGGFPIIYGGLALGPVPGFIIGVVSDLLGFLVRPSSQAFNLAFTLTSGLTGAIPILILKLFGNKKDNKTNFVKVLIGIFIGQTITSVIMVPFFMKIFFGSVFIERLLKALSKQIWSIPLYAFLFVETWKVVSRQIDFDTIKQNTDFAVPAK